MSEGPMDFSWKALEKRAKADRAAILKAGDLTDMAPEVLGIYAKAFTEAHQGPARGGLSVEVGTRRGGSALMFLMLLEQIYKGLEKPHLFTVDPYGYKPYVSGVPKAEDAPIYGDPDYLAMKALLAGHPNHAHFKMTSSAFFKRMAGCSYWVPGPVMYRTKHQPGEFPLGEERVMGNLAFCLLDGDHSLHAISGELGALYFPPMLSVQWMHPQGIVCVDTVDCDPNVVLFLKRYYKAEVGPTWAIIRGPKDMDIRYRSRGEDRR